MKLSVLERALFVALFVLIATVCLALLFGYRYSFGQQRVEQRGVLVLHGAQRDLRVDFLGREQKVSLPHVDTNVPFGTHRLHLAKTGYLAQEQEVTVQGSEATILRVELAPMLLTGQALTRPLGKKDVLAAGHEQELLLISSASGVLLTHVGTREERQTYLPTYLRSKRFDSMTVQEINEREILLSADGEHFLYSVQSNAWKQLPRAEETELVIDQGHLLAWDKKTGDLWKLRSQTGDRESRPLLTDVVGRERSIASNLRTGQHYHIYTLQGGVRVMLESAWMGDLSVRPVPTSDALLLREKTFPRTASGYVFSETSNLAAPRSAFVHGDTAYIQTEDLSLYVLQSEDGLSYGTKLSAPVLSIVPSPLGNALFVQTETSLLFCEAQQFRRCDTLAQSDLASVRRGVSRDGTYLWFVQEDILNLVPFFSDAS